MPTGAWRSATPPCAYDGADDVQETSRVVYDGFPWDIKGIAELGRRRELELICQTDVHRPGVTFTPVIDAGRILWGAAHAGDVGRRHRHQHGEASSG